MITALEHTRAACAAKSTDDDVTSKDSIDVALSSGFVDRSCDEQELASMVTNRTHRFLVALLIPQRFNLSALFDSQIQYVK